MRDRVALFTLAALLFAGAGKSSAQEPAEIIDKAIKAYGGVENLRKMQNVVTRSRGDIDLGLGRISFDQESKSTAAGQMKNVMRMKFMGRDVASSVVFDGNKGWVQVGNDTKEMEPKQVEQIKEDVHMAKLGQLDELKDTSKYQLTALGEIQVNGKPALGVKVSSKDHKDVKFYFDKADGLMVKMERNSHHPQTMEPAVEERITTSWQRVDGIPTPKTIVVRYTGKEGPKEAVSAELYEVKFLPKIDENEFAKP